MTLGDQLQELRFNILRDRSDLIAGDSDSLWSDETLLRYIKDGERRFARQTLIIRDGSIGTQYTQIKLKVGVRDYPLHPDVLAVLSARVNGKDYDLRRSGHQMVQAQQPPGFLEFDPLYGATLPPGDPLAFYTDETLVYGAQQRVTASIYPVPDITNDGVLVNLRVVRLPKGPYTKDDFARESEIPEDYQLDPLQWAAYRAQSTYEGDAGAPDLAQKHKDAFDEAVKNAQREMRRRSFVQPGLRYGTNGFSWTR